MSGNILQMPGGHRSASQRRIEQLMAFQDHLLTVIAVLTVQAGGLTMVSGESLKRQYDLTPTRDPETGNVVYHAKPIEGSEQEPLMPALGDEAKKLDGEKPS